MSDVFRTGEVLRATRMNRLLLEKTATTTAALAAPYADAAAASAAEAEVSAAEAEASADDAAASAITANGVVGLGTTTGTASAYNVTASVGPGANRVGKVKFHVTNVVHPVNLTWNGTTRSLRRADAGTLLAGMFDTAKEYLIFDTGTVFTVQEVGQSPKVFTSLETLRTGTFNIDHRQIGDAQPRVREQITAAGEKILRLGGDGTTLPPQSFEFTSASARHLTGNFLDRRNRALFSPFNPVPFGAAIAEHATAGADRSKLDYGNETVFVTGTGGAYQIGPPNQGKLLRFSGTRFATAHHMAPGDPVNLSVDSGTLVLHTGYVGATPGSAPMEWLGFSGATKIALTAPWRGVLHRWQGDMTVTPATGATTAASSVAALPTYARGVFWIGQSWMDQETDSAPFGMQEEFARLGLDWSVLSARFTAFGASGLWKNGVSTTSDPTNYWYDEDTGTLGPNAVDSLLGIADALAAEGAPAIANWYGVFNMGLPDLLSLEAGGYYTPAQYTTDLAHFFALFRAELELLATGLSGAKIFICPIPPQPPGAFNPLCYGPLRRAQLNVCTVDADCVRGPDYAMELLPFDNVHHYLEGRANHGRMIAQFIHNLGSGTEFPGPKIVTIARLATDAWRITFDRNGGTALNREIVPVCFGIALSTATLATRLVIDDQSWTWGGTPRADTVDFVTDGDDGVSAPVFYWPDGHGFETQEKERTVYAFDALGRRRPLQTYHPTV